MTVKTKSTYLKLDGYMY